MDEPHDPLQQEIDEKIMGALQGFRDLNCVSYRSRIWAFLFVPVKVQTTRTLRFYSKSALVRYVLQ